MRLTQTVQWWPFSREFTGYILLLLAVVTWLSVGDHYNPCDECGCPRGMPVDCDLGAYVSAEVAGDNAPYFGFLHQHCLMERKIRWRASHTGEGGLPYRPYSPEESPHVEWDHWVQLAGGSRTYVVLPYPGDATNK